MNGGRSGRGGNGEEGEASGGMPLGKALEHLVELRRLGRAMALTGVAAVWSEVVGPEAALHMRPVSLDGGQLVVEVDHPSWATQAQLSASDVLGRLRQELGDEAPSSLAARVARPGRPRQL